MENQFGEVLHARNPTKHGTSDNKQLKRGKEKTNKQRKKERMECQCFIYLV